MGSGPSRADASIAGGLGSSGCGKLSQRSDTCSSQETTSVPTRPATQDAAARMRPTSRRPPARPNPASAPDSHSAVSAGSSRLQPDLPHAEWHLGSFVPRTPARAGRRAPISPADDQLADDQLAATSSRDVPPARAGRRAPTSPAVVAETRTPDHSPSAKGSPKEEGMLAAQLARLERLKGKYGDHVATNMLQRQNSREQGATGYDRPMQPPLRKPSPPSTASPSNSSLLSCDTPTCSEGSAAVALRLLEAADTQAMPAVTVSWQRGERIGAGSFGNVSDPSSPVRTNCSRFYSADLDWKSIGRPPPPSKPRRGQVFLGMNRTTGELMAVKQIHYSSSGLLSLSAEENAQALQREISSLQLLRHPNIVYVTASQTFHLVARSAEALIRIRFPCVPGAMWALSVTSECIVLEPQPSNWCR